MSKFWRAEDMCENLCGDPRRQHEPPDGRVVYCVPCGRLVSGDLAPFRWLDWADHTLGAPGVEHQSLCTPDDEEVMLDAFPLVDGFRRGDQVTGSTDAEAVAVTGQVTSFAVLGDQGFLAFLNQRDKDDEAIAFYTCDLHK